MPLPDDDDRPAGLNGWRAFDPEQELSPDHDDVHVLRRTLIGLAWLAASLALELLLERLVG
jgi:hypothetical protein